MISTVHNLSSRLFKFVLKEQCCFVRKYTVEKTYKLLFFGSDCIALSSLKRVNEFRKKGHTIDRLDLVTANCSINRTEIENYAHKENIKTISWPLQSIQTAEYDLGLIVAFGHLIKQDILNKFPLGMVNVHPSLLPRWRGAAPIIHTLLHGDDVTGVSLMKIKPDIYDVGEIISQTKVPVSKDIRLPELTTQLSEIGAEMLLDCVKRLPESLKHGQPQSEEGVTHARKISKDICRVEWSEMTAVQVYNLYRAIYGIYPLSTKFRDKHMKLFDAFLANEEEVRGEKPPGTLEYSEIMNSIRVLCKDRRYVYFKSVRIVGKRQISALDFFNGYIKNLPEDDRMGIVLRNQ